MQWANCLKIKKNKLHGKQNFLKWHFRLDLMSDFKHDDTFENKILDLTFLGYTYGVNF